MFRLYDLTDICEVLWVVIVQSSLINIVGLTVVIIPKEKGDKWKYVTVEEVSFQDDYELHSSFFVCIWAFDNVTNNF